MSTKHIALLAAGALTFSACQAQSDRADVAAVTTQVSLSDIIHLPLGNAELHEQGGQLFATNMRTLDDGVRSLYQPSLHWQAELDWADDVSAIVLNAINSSLSGEDTTSSLSLLRDNNAWSVHPTFVSPRYTVRVYRGATLVGSLPHSDQPLAIHLTPGDYVPPPRGTHFHAHRSLPPGGTVPMQQCSWELRWLEQVTVVRGSRVLRGDRIELIELAHESYGGFDEIQVLGNGNVTYLSEQFVPE